MLNDQLDALMEQVDEQSPLDRQEALIRDWQAKVGQATMTHILTWQSQQALERPQCPNCHRLCTWQGMRTTTVQTLLGLLPLTRRYAYCARCRQGICPLDQVLGIVGTRTSVGVQREASYLMAHLTYEETAQVMQRTYPVAITACQIERLSAAVGQAMRRDEEDSVQAAWEAPLPDQQSDERLYISMDGVYARVRRDAADLTADEQRRSGDVYREIKVATLFRCQPGRKRSHLVCVDGRVDTVTHTWYRARRATAEEFGPQVSAAAVEQGVDACTDVVVLGDGAPWIWNLAAEHFPCATQIVDVWHAQQYLWDVARAVYGNAQDVGQGWARHACELLLTGRLSELIDGLLALAELPLTPGTHQRTPATALLYFQFHAHRMRYPEFRARGLLIGSGPTEAGCKSVVSTRFKRSGMRWS